MSTFGAHYLERFERDVLPKLNEAQRTAVDLIEGPVMVIAGPGTGKTQLLAARIGNILRLTDTDPREILCLTYTEAGALAMRQRLIQFLGPEGHRVPVFTFHGFCNLVIQENPAIFGGYRELQPISELETRSLLKSLIDALPAEHPLRRLRGDYYYNVRRLASLFDLMKREDFSPEHIEDAINRYLADLPFRDEYQYKRKYKEFPAGSVKQAKIDDETARMEETRVAARLLPLWQECMEKEGRYDFSDMLRWVQKAFATEEDLLRVYQERFLYMLVDEYQDTSGLQNAILYQLVQYWESPNVFVVGDDDQAIYRFQGASMTNILAFQERFQPQAVMLTDNYRSSQAILNSADALIGHNQERLNNRLGLVKQLTAQRTDIAQPGVSPRLLEFHSSTAEESWIAGRIQTLLQEGVPAKEMAVLYRNHRHCDNLLRLCRQRGIPILQQRREDILHDPFIRGLLEVMHYLDGESRSPFSEEARLVQVLHYRYFGITPLDLARLMRFMQDKNQRKENGPYFQWRELLADAALLEAAGLQNPKNVFHVGQIIESWIQAMPEWTLQTLFEKIITEGGVFQTLLQDPQKRRLLELVTTLFDYIKNETSAEPDLSLNTLLSRLDEMIEGGIALPYVHYVGHPEGVLFTTVHSAKGLEWRHVFMIACSAKNWSGKSNGRDFKLPDTLLRSDAASADQQLEEERRLFFVGMTRAQEGLNISYSQDQKNANNTRTTTSDLAARFFVELQESAGLQIETMDIPATIREQALEEMLHPLDENPSLLEEDWLRDNLRDFSMSVTALNKYLNCPRAFYYENILKVPGARNRFMGYGNAVHRALEGLFKRNSGLEGDVTAQLIELFEGSMKHFRSHFTDQEYENTLEHGRQNLPDYLAQALPVWRLATKVELEKSIRNVEWMGYPIKGNLDKIEFYPDGVMVVDYKTGNPDRARAKLQGAGPDWKEEPGGDYWRQIVFYELLIRADRSINWPVKAGVMEFVEKDSRGNYPRAAISVGQEEIDVVTEQIAFAFDGIRKLDFSRGCHSEDCTWCQLVDHHILPQSLTPGEGREGEDEE